MVKREDEILREQNENVQQLIENVLIRELGVTTPSGRQPSMG